MADDVYYQILRQNGPLPTRNKLKKQLNIKTSDTLLNLKNENASVVFFNDSEGVDSIIDDGSNSGGYIDYSSYSENTHGRYQNPSTYYQQTEDISRRYIPSQDTQSYVPYAGQEQNGYGYDQNNGYGTTSGYQRKIV